MKLFSLFLVLTFISIFSFGQKEKLDVFFNKADVFMSMNVTNGLVDYQEIAKQRIALDDLILEINTLKVISVEDKSYQKSFLINAYNLLVIKGIIDNFPVQSPKEIIGFFNRKKHEVADFGLVTLNELENDLIRKVYMDARVHFVLVCAGNSCPPLIDEAYTPSKLENQLQVQTKKSMDNPDFIRVNAKEVSVSEIFKWYEEDFVTKGSRVVDFINNYRKEKLSSKSKISYYNYDWSLNSQSVFQKEGIKSNILEFTPSKLMGIGQWDLKLFNNLYTQTKSANNQQKVTKKESRQSYFTTTLEAYTGVAKNSRINVGAIINIKSNKGNNASALDVFEFKTEQGLSRAGISSLGIALKVSPFKKINNFSLQSNFFFPVFNDLSGSFYLDKRSYVWENRFYYDKSFGADKFQVFAQLDLTYNFGELSKDASLDENSEERFANNSLAFPLAVFLSYFPSQKFTVYLNAQQYQLLPTVQGGFGQEFTVAGIGAKHQVTPRLNLEISSSIFLRGTSSGLGNTYNLGLRYVY